MAKIPTDDEIIKEEIDAILVDLVIAYNNSGRKASGQWAKGLEAVYEPNKGTIRGFVYLAGRGKTKKAGKPGEPTLVESILKWMKVRGIAAKIRAKAKTSKAKIYKVKGVAWAIADKIHKKGTDRKKWFRIYEEVISPSRIQQIIDRLAVVNTNRIITEIDAELEILAKNV